jgi:enoyl-CoA hydratase/carnithine racemase
VGEPVVETTDETGVRTIRLNRPEALNAFNRQLYEELHDTLRGAERDETVRVVVLTQDRAGTAWCKGNDAQEVRAHYAERRAEARQNRTTIRSAGRSGASWRGRGRLSDADDGTAAPRPGRIC